MAVPPGVPFSLPPALLSNTKEDQCTLCNTAIIGINWHHRCGHVFHVLCAQTLSDGTCCDITCREPFNADDRRLLQTGFNILNGTNDTNSNLIEDNTLSKNSKNKPDKNNMDNDNSNSQSGVSKSDVSESKHTEFDIGVGVGVDGDGDDISMTDVILQMKRTSVTPQAAKNLYSLKDDVSILIKADFDKMALTELAGDTVEFILKKNNFIIRVYIYFFLCYGLLFWYVC